MIRRSSAEVTGVTVDRLKAAGGKTGGGVPSVSFRMLNTLAVNVVLYYIIAGMCIYYMYTIAGFYIYMHNSASVYIYIYIYIKSLELEPSPSACYQCTEPAAPAVIVSLHNLNNLQLIVPY